MKFLARLLLLLAFVGVADAQVYTKFGPATGILKGSTSTYQTSAAASSDVVSLWTGTCTGTTNVLAGGGTCVALPAGSSSANPTASVGLSIVNGSASTFMRSDGAPALSVAIAPTWSGVHTFTQGIIGNGGITLNSSGAGSEGIITGSNNATENFQVTNNSTGTAAVAGYRLFNGSHSAEFSLYGPSNSSGESTNIGSDGAQAVHLILSNTAQCQITSTVAFACLGPTAGTMVNMVPDTGTFTETYATGFSTTPTGTVVFSKMGNIACLTLPTLTATSSTSAFTITGLPVELQAARTQRVSVGGMEDNTVINALGGVSVTNSGTLTMTLSGSSTGFTATGTKGVTATTFCYILN